MMIIVVKKRFDFTSIHMWNVRIKWNELKWVMKENVLTEHENKIKKKYREVQSSIQCLSTTFAVIFIDVNHIYEDLSVEISEFEPLFDNNIELNQFGTTSIFRPNIHGGQMEFLQVLLNCRWCFPVDQVRNNGDDDNYRD